MSFRNDKDNWVLRNEALETELRSAKDEITKLREERSSRYENESSKLGFKEEKMKINLFALMAIIGLVVILFAISVGATTLILFLAGLD